MTGSRRAAVLWLAVGVAGFALVPWYALQDTVWWPTWAAHIAARDNAPAWLQAWSYGRAWLWPVGALLAAGAWIAGRPPSRARAGALLALGASGFAYTLGQGFVIGPQGWYFDALKAVLPPLATGQYGMGLGATLVLASFAMLFALGLAGRGYFKGDAFVAGSAVAVAALVALFTFFPVFRILISAAQDANETLSLTAFGRRLFTEKVWGIGCITGTTRCGVAWNTLLLAFSCATACTALGLAFALIWHRTQFRFKRALRMLSVLPIITPPFVIGLGLILIFGRSGLINQFLEWALAVEPTRWIYGFQGVLLSQVFAFTPIAFLVLIGVVEGISPTLEEAGQTLGGSPAHVLSTVSLTLMAPGLAN